jgi:hypothetical protein
MLEAGVRYRNQAGLMVPCLDESYIAGPLRETIKIDPKIIPVEALGSS